MLYPDMEEKHSLHYVGPEGGVWTYFLPALSVFGIDLVIVISPSKHAFTFNMFDTSPLHSFFVGNGTCTNIIPKENDKPTKDETKD